MLPELWNHASLGLNKLNIWYEVENAFSAWLSQETKTQDL